MGQFFREGGFGMYPTALFGLSALVLSAWYAIRPLPRLLPLVKGLGAAALLAGLLGTTMGIKATVTAIAASPELAPDRMPLIAMAGVGESINNLVLALVLTVLVALAVGVGGFRARPTDVPSVG